VWSYGLLKHEGSYIGAGDGEAAFGKMACDYACSASRGSVEQTWRTDDGPGEIGLCEFYIAVAMVCADIAEKCVGHYLHRDASVAEEKC